MCEKLITQKVLHFLEYRGLSRKVRASRDCQLTFAWYCTWDSRSRRLWFLSFCSIDIILFKAENIKKKNTAARGIARDVKKFKFIAIASLLMDVLPLLTKLSRYFQKDEVNLLVVKPVIQSTIQSLQQVKQHLDNETPEDNSIPCLKKLVSAVAGGSYMDQPLTATDGQKVQFFCHGKQFIQVLIDNLNE